MKYRDPRTIYTPKNQISDVKVLYDGKSGYNAGETGFSIARVTWNGNKTLAMRWNVSHVEYDDQDKVAGKAECKVTRSPEDIQLGLLYRRRYLTQIHQ